MSIYYTPLNVGDLFLTTFRENSGYAQEYSNKCKKLFFVALTIKSKTIKQKQQSGIKKCVSYFYNDINYFISI